MLADGGGGGFPLTRHIRLVTALVLVPLLLAGSIQPAAPSASDADAASGSSGGALPGSITGLSHVTHVADVPRGSGLWAEGDHVYVAGLDDGFFVVDASTPENPQVVGEVDGLFGRDVDMLHYADGRKVAVVAAEWDGIHLVNVTDPTDPTHLSTEYVGSHNAAVLPGTHLIYNSRSISVGAQGVDIIDASDPANPQPVRFADDVLTCHDITFHVSDDEARGYCAGVAATQVWDLDDPLNPQVKATIANPAINIHHWAKPAWNGDLLIIGDEHTGALTYGCGAYAEAGGVSASDTVGALWFYDLTVEEVPVPLGYVSAPTPEDDADPLPPLFRPCTSHFGDLVGDRDMLVVGWYMAGTALVDFSNPVNPRIVDRVDRGGSVWDAQVLNGYVYTGDRFTGMDVLTFTGS